MRYTTEERNRRKEQLLQRMEAKRRVMGFAVGMCILLAVMISYALLQQNDIQRQYIYPYHYRGVIEKYSQQYQVDEYLVIAMVKTESKFQPEAVSGFGAMGLRPLRPEPAIWSSGQLDDTGFYLDQLKEPQCNIRYGSWYLASLQEEFQGNEVLMLAAYNAGRGNVLSWMKQYGWDYSFNNPEEIPYRETQEYVKSVLGNRNKYQKLYEVKE